MKKVISLLAFSILLTTVSYSQNAEGKSKGVGGQSLEQLNLTEQQKAKVSGINEDFRAKIKALQADKTLSPEQVNTQRRNLANDRRKQILEVLTPEQRTQYEASRPSSGNRFDIEKYRKSLELTDEQYQKLKELISASREKEKSMMKGSDMTPEQRKAYLDAMNKNNMEIMKTILTPAQMSKLDQLAAPPKEAPAEKAKPAGKGKS